jgi:hypothetical protein
VTEARARKLAQFNPTQLQQVAFNLVEDGRDGGA